MILVSLFFAIREVRKDISNKNLLDIPEVRKYTKKAVAITKKNKTKVVPYRSTLRIGSGYARDGDTPAAWIKPNTSPRHVAF